MQMVPFQIDSARMVPNTVPGAADGARQYGEGLGCEEVARKYRGKTGVLHADLNTDGTLLGGIESDSDICRQANREDSPACCGRKPRRKSRGKAISRGLLRSS